MNKQIISGIILAVMLLANVYLVYRVNANTMSIAAYDAGFSQRSGVGQLENFWTKYIGGSKSSSFTYEDRENTEADSSMMIGILFVLDIAAIGALYVLNKKPKPEPIEEDDDDWRVPRGSRRIGDKIRSRRR